MISETLQNKIIRLTREIEHNSEGRYRHCSFLVNKSRIIEIGINRPRQTHPLAKRYGYRYDCIHSELDLIIKVTNSGNLGNLGDLSNYLFINTRLGLDKLIRISKPCKICIRLLKDFNIKKVIYTNYYGKFVEESINSLIS